MQLLYLTLYDCSIEVSMKENGVIDWEAYGGLLKAARLMSGYSRGAALADEVEKRTGMHVSERMLYAIESATRAPSADIFLALQMVLPPLRDPEYLRPVFKNSGIEVAIVSL